MKLGRKIKKVKEKFLYFLRFILHKKLYNIILLQLSKRKFINCISSTKYKIKKSQNLDKINKFEYKVTSQNNEDGIIDFLSKKIKKPDKFFFEIGFDFYEFNSLNLIKKNWTGVLVDGDQIKCDKLNVCIARYFPNSNTKIYNSFINYKNINKIINNYVNKKNFDFFSLDTDGMDYWILQNLKFKPKIICLEFNSWLGEFSSLVIPKKLNFNYKSDMYFGASLKAYKNLLKKKNYKLVAIESSGNNAFFIQQDEFSFNFEELNIEESFKRDPKFTDKDYKQVYSRLIKNKWLKI